MSDRIDELVAEAEFLNDNGCDKCEIVIQLATIAREAEAMCDWLAEHRTHWEQPNDDVLVHHSRYRADVVPLRIKAAEEAVAQE